MVSRVARVHTFLVFELSPLPRLEVGHPLSDTLLGGDALAYEACCQCFASYPSAAMQLVKLRQTAGVLIHVFGADCTRFAEPPETDEWEPLAAEAERQLQEYCCDGILSIGPCDRAMTSLNSVPNCLRFFFCVGVCVCECLYLP